MPSPVSYIPGGFNFPATTGTPQTTTTTNNLGFNPAGTIGQNPTLADTNPMTQFNAAAYNPFANDPRTAMLYQSATGQLDRMVAKRVLNLTPQNITTGLGGLPVATGAGMDSMTFGVVLSALNPTKDPEGFVTLMEKVLQDPKGSFKIQQYPQFVKAYYDLKATQMASVGGAAGVPTAAAATAQSPQLDPTKIVALLQKLGATEQDIASLTTASGSTGTTTQQQTQALLRKTINPTA